MKMKLYLDFDGVILDTINVTNKMKEELGLKKYDEIREFYRTINWNKLIKETRQINNSIDNIKRLIESNLYDVEILTHINSEHEAKEKIKYLSNIFPNLQITPVPKIIEKCEVVDPLNSILVDDYSKNLLLWEINGGIAIKFTQEDEEDKDYITINSLEELLYLYNDLCPLVDNKYKKRQLN